MAESGELIIDLGVDTQEAISIAVELETAAAIKNVEELRAVLESTRKSIEQMGKLFAEAFSPAVNGLKSVQAGLQSLNAATSDAANSVQALMSQLS